MLNYEEMSDLQINLLVAKAAGVDAVENSGVVFGGVKHEGSNVVSVIGVVDYCNNPSDAWPIITGNRISILATYRGGDMYTASAGDDGEISFECDNPLRSAMIAYLMMKDEEK